MSTIPSFRNVENKHYVYRRKDCMKTFCESFRKHTMNIVNLKKEIKLLPKENQNVKKQKSVKFARKTNI